MVTWLILTLYLLHIFLFEAHYVALVPAIKIYILRYLS